MPTAADLLDLGLTPAAIRRRVREGSLHRLARGLYDQTDPTSLTPEARHLLLVEAMLPRLKEGSVLCHASAGVAHQLWLPAATLELVHVTRPGSSPSRGRRVRIHPWTSPSTLTWRVADRWSMQSIDLKTTTLSLLSTLPMPEATAVADSALRQGLDRAAALATVDGWSPHRPGRRRVRLALELANPLSESAGESRSRWIMHEQGIEPPVLQQELYNADGVFLGRGDFYWPAYRVVGEFDGKVKYGRLLRKGQTVEQVIRAERTREVSLQNAGFTMTRWTWQSLQHPQRFRDQLRCAFRTR